ncbi:MAG: BlaI/MecI/CopY family transcriptional regulator [Hungatella sp.]|jgi:BlaI family penicillinase repressor|nr:BlaI/MecI/CopY family transcriptional regulator [Hungatella sp.]
MELTKNELEIMKVLWNTKRPLTGTEIVQLSPDTKSWKDSSIHILINSLLKKKAIKEHGFVKIGKSYGRTFTPTESGEEYYARYLVALADRTSIKKVFATLFDNTKISGETISELEDLLKKYKGDPD